MKNKRHLVLIFIFLSFLLYPSVVGLISISSDISKVSPSKEKFPRLENNNVFKYFSDFDTYYSKEFNGRNTYYRAISGLKYNLFGTSAKRESIITGKDEFLFLGNDASNIIDETIGLDLFSDSEIELIQKRVSRAANWLYKKDVRFYVMVAPNKHTIYPEKLPFKVDTDRRTKVDQIADMIDDTNKVTWIELEQPLMRAKKRELLYHKTDSHWNTFGAYIAYREIMNALNEDFPGEFKPIPLKKMKRYHKENNMFGLSRMLGYTIPESTHGVKIPKPRSKKQASKLKVKGRKNASEEIRYKAPKKKRKVIIVRDSFSAALIGFLKEHFEESVFIWTSKLNRNVILNEKPDIVIYEIVERNVDNMKKM